MESQTKLQKNTSKRKQKELDKMTDKILTSSLQLVVKNAHLRTNLTKFRRTYAINNK